MRQRDGAGAELRGVREEGHAARGLDRHLAEIKQDEEAVNAREGRTAAASVRAPRYSSNRKPGVDGLARSAASGRNQI